MSGNKVVLLLILLGAGSLTAESPSHADLHKLDKFLTPVPYGDDRDWSVTQNLGATGCRGWIRGKRGNTTESREILIKSITPGSPADGVLKPYDIIIGTDETPFVSDARIAFSKALTHAEGKEGGGNLNLLCVRNGERQQITVKIPFMGDYSPTAPNDCEKTKKVVAQSTNILAKYMPDEGYRGMSGALNSLLLLATQDPKVMDHVRRSAMNMGPNHTITDAGHETWRWGYVNVFLCEYFLATGDRRVLQSIKDYSDHIAKGQANPGTWGHRAVSNGIPPGYGSMNQSGLICFLSLVLAEQCGVEVDHQAIANSVRFFGRYAGWGGIPYGDHGADSSASGNGKNGSAAVVFNLLGAKRASQWFSSLCVSSNLAHFEDGHTGNYFSQIWAPIAASLAGEKNYQRFWARFNSYRDMARFWAGGFLTQPLPQRREGPLSSSHAYKGPLWSTGALTLGYLGGTEKLAILGRRESVFGKRAPEEFKKALKEFYGRNYGGCLKELATLKNSTDPKVKKMALQLEKMAQLNLESIALTLVEIQKNMTRGDLFLVQKQVEALEGIVEKDHGKLGSLQAKLSEPESLEIIESRGRFYGRLIKEFGVVKPNGFWEHPLPPIVSDWARKRVGSLVGAKGFYRQQGIKLKEKLGAGPVVKKLVENLATSSNATEAKAEFPIEDPAVVRELRAKWTIQGKMSVRLNGTEILNLEAPYGTKEIEVILKPITQQLLKRGSNQLSVEGEEMDRPLKGKLSLVSLEQPKPIK